MGSRGGDDGGVNGGGDQRLMLLLLLLGEGERTSRRRAVWKTSSLLKIGRLRGHSSELPGSKTVLVMVYRILRGRLVDEGTMGGGRHGSSGVV